METNDEEQKRNLMLEAHRRDLEYKANQKVKKPFRVMVLLNLEKISENCEIGSPEPILVCLN